MVVALVIRDAVVRGALGFVLTVILEAALRRVLRSRAQVHLQVLHDVRLAVLEVVGNVGAHHAHLAVALAVGASLALVRHQRRLSANLRPHRLSALPLRKHGTTLGQLLLVSLAILGAIGVLDLGSIIVF